MNVPAAAEFAPIVVPSIAPPLISAVAIVPVVKVPATAVPAPITVLSIFPALISTVANVAVPSTFKVPSKSVAPVTSNVPGRSKLFVHSTSDPFAAVCNTCLAEPSANLLTAISAAALISALTILPSLILELVTESFLRSYEVILLFCSSCRALNICSWLLLRSPALTDDPAA